MTIQRKLLTYQISNGKVEIPVEIKRSGRKTLGLEVKSDGTVLARVPLKLTDGEVIEFLEKHSDWIARKVFQVQERKEKNETAHIVSAKDLTSEEIEKIKDKFYQKVRFYSEKMGVTFGKITIRNQKTRWGSCSSKGNLNFNYQLYYLPEELLDYVVVHELAHRRHMNHSGEFWKEVEVYYPNYLQCRKRLKQICIENHEKDKGRGDQKE